MDEPVSGPALVAAMPFAAQVGVSIDEASPDQVSGRLEWTPQRCTAAGAMHGGALMTLADSVGAACAFLNLEHGATTATIESTSRIFRAVLSGYARAIARPLHLGRSFFTIEVVVTDDQGRLVASVTQTQAVIRPSRDGGGET